MQITILGTRGEVDHSSPYHSRHSGILIDGVLLVDLGEREYLDRKPEAVLITHLHPDHAYFVRCKKNIPAPDMPVYAPEKSEHANVRVLDKKMTLEGYHIQPIPTHHSIKVKSQAYRIDRESRAILYTGDLIWINKEYHRLLEGLDLVITEGSYVRKGGLVRRDRKTGKIYGHAGIPDLVRLFKDYCSHIVLIHFGSWFYKGAKKARRKIRDLAKQNGVTITVGYDNMDIVK